MEPEEVLNYQRAPYMGHLPPPTPPPPQRTLATAPTNPGGHTGFGSTTNVDTLLAEERWKSI